MAVITIERGFLQIDGSEALMRVSDTRIGGGEMRIDIVQPEGTSESEAVFDGWAVWTVAVALELLEQRDGGRGRYGTLALIRAAARQRRDDGKPEQHTFTGDLARALEVDRVLIRGLDPIRDSTEDDTLRLTLSLSQVDPRIGIELRQREETQVSSSADADEVDTSGEGWVSQEDQSTLAAAENWGDEF